MFVFRTFLGSISDYVMHHAQSTVIIVRLSEHLEQHDPLKSSGLPRTVVLAVDGSPEVSKRCFKTGLPSLVPEEDLRVLNEWNLVTSGCCTRV